MKKMKCNFFVAVFCLFTLLNSIPVFSAEAVVDDEIPDCSFHLATQWDIKNTPRRYDYLMYLTNINTDYEIVLVLSENDSYQSVYPVLFAKNGGKINAHVKGIKKDPDFETDYSTFTEYDITDSTAFVSSTSRKMRAVRLPLTSGQNEPVGTIPDTNLCILKYPEKKVLDPTESVRYVLDEYEKGGNTFEGNPNYYNPNDYKSDLSGIGYLQNVTFHTNYVDGTNSDNTYSYITYDSMTNTGFDITKPGVNIALYTAPRFAYCSSLGDYLKNTPTVVYGDKTYRNKAPGSDCRIDFSMLELRSAYNSEAQLYQQKAFVGTPVILKLQYWLRVEYDSPNGNKCGGWVRIADDDNSAAETNKRTETFDPDGKKTTDGGYSDGTPTSDKTGHGQTEEDASNNESDSITTGGNEGNSNVNLSWFLDQLEALKNSLGQFPQLVSTVFGWLPSPVVTLVGVGIAIVIVVSLIKAVRG